MSRVSALVMTSLVNRLIQALSEVGGRIPPAVAGGAGGRRERAQAIAHRAALSAAATAGSLGLPPGPTGLLTILPDLVAVWKIQTQMVADIAACYGRTASLSREQMLYCLFRHAAGQAFRGLVVKVGESVLVKKASFGLFQKLLQKIGIRVTQRLTGRVVARWIPLVGALGVGAYVYYDTRKIAETTIALFRGKTAPKALTGADAGQGAAKTLPNRVALPAPQPLSGESARPRRLLTAR